MGLFCMNSEKIKTVEGCIKCATSNLELLSRYPEADYLKSFIRVELQDALDALEQDNIVEKEDNRYNW